MTDIPNIVLAIESAIAGGSLSLQVNGVEAGQWIGSSSVSKAEELLPNIDRLLNSVHVAKSDLDLIAVSAGPGSFTGVRIGIATTLGLKTGLNLKMASESALRAMALIQAENDDELIIAVPVGRNAVCLQTFSKAKGSVIPVDEPHTMPEDRFFTWVEDHDSKIVLHSALAARSPRHPSIIDFGTNIAFAIGQICRQNPDNMARPLFISKAF